MCKMLPAGRSSDPTGLHASSVTTPTDADTMNVLTGVTDDPLIDSAAAPPQAAASGEQHHGGGESLPTCSAPLDAPFEDLSTALLAANVCSATGDFYLSRVATTQFNTPAAGCVSNARLTTASTVFLIAPIGVIAAALALAIIVRARRKRHVEIRITVEARAAADIQAAVRGNLARDRLTLVVGAATFIQAIAVGKMVRAWCKSLHVWARWATKVRARLRGHKVRAEVQQMRAELINNYVPRFLHNYFASKHADAAVRKKKCHLPTTTSPHFTRSCFPMTFHVMFVLAKYVMPYMAPMSDFGTQQIYDLVFNVGANLELIEGAYTQPFHVWSLSPAWSVLAAYKNIIECTTIVHLWNIRGSRPSEELTAFVRFWNWYLGAVARKIESGDFVLVPPAALWIIAVDYPFRKYSDVDEYINESLQWKVDEVLGTDHTDVDGVDNLLTAGIKGLKQRKKAHGKKAQGKDQPELDLGYSDSDSSDGDA